jgi:hypothetical protein
LRFRALFGGSTVHRMYSLFSRTVKFFAVRADSAALNFVAEVGIFAVTVTVATYFSQFKFTGWKELKNDRVRIALTIIYSALPALVIYSVLGRFINYIVQEIVRGQLIH